MRVCAWLTVFGGQATTSPVKHRRLVLVTAQVSPGCSYLFCLQISGRSRRLFPWYCISRMLVVEALATACCSSCGRHPRRIGNVGNTGIPAEPDDLCRSPGLQLTRLPMCLVTKLFSAAIGTFSKGTAVSSRTLKICPVRALQLNRGE